MTEIVWYKGTGGLTHMLRGVARTIEIAREHGCLLVIDTERAPTVLSKFSKWFTLAPEVGVTYTDSLDDLPPDATWKGLSMAELRAAKPQYQEGGYTLAGHSVGLHVVPSERVYAIATSGPVRHPDLQHVRVTPWCAARVRDIAIPIKGQYVGLHYRNTDMKHDLASLMSEVIAKFEEVDSKTLYLATDDAHALEQVRSFLPFDYTIVQYAPPPDCRGRGVHFGCRDKERVMLNCLADMLMLIRATAFVASPSSSMSSWIGRLRVKNTLFSDM